MTVTTTKQSLNGKTENENNCPRWDLKMEILDQRPTHYYCHHQTPFENMVLRSIAFLNMRVGCVTSRRLLDSI